MSLHRWGSYVSLQLNSGHIIKALDCSLTFALQFTPIRAVRSFYYTGAVGAMLVYDITKRQRNYEDMETRTLSVNLKASVLCPPRMLRNSLKGKDFSS
ncbi:hypothetical protein C5167_027187 [Papaver somniferum]|nr:hypothetical protein C5167_027187 [Papaver somniferum]